MTTPQVRPTPAPTPRLASGRGGHGPTLATTEPRTAADRARATLRRLLQPFWVIPAIWCVLAVVAGLVLPRVGAGEHTWLPFAFRGGSDGARTMLSTTAGAMISVTGLVFSITIVVLQLASSQFTPRVLRTFLDDRVTQHTLGVFAASFLYALTVLRAISGPTDGAGDRVPQTAVVVAFLLVLAAVAMFLAFIHTITRSISVTSVVQQVSDETRALLERSKERRRDLPLERPELARQSRQSVARAVRSGRLNTIDLDLLVDLAGRHDVRIEVLYPLGSFVPAGAPIAMVHGAGTEVDWDAALGKGLGITRERSMDQDVTFGFRRLVDIAERALSPG